MSNEALPGLVAAFSTALRTETPFCGGLHLIPLRGAPSQVIVKPDKDDGRPSSHLLGHAQSHHSLHRPPRVRNLAAGSVGVGHLRGIRSQNNGPKS